MSKIKIFGGQKLDGVINIPASKSIMHRAIIAASLSRGDSVIKNINLSDDVLATLNAVEKLGAIVKINGNELTIRGISSFDLDHDVVLNCHESASTLRFLIPLCTLFNRNIKLTGTKTLLNRPLDIYEKIFIDNNATFIRSNDSITVGGAIFSSDFTLDGSISSQFITGLLFTLCLKNHDSIINIKNVSSLPYILLTIDVLKSFGIDIKFDNNVIKIKGNQKYKNIIYNVSGDFSAASNFFVLNFLSGADIKFNNLDYESLQGDKEIINILKQHNDIIDIKDIPDLGPILMVLLTKNGGYLKNYERLIYKESDRIFAMACELKKFGVIVKEEGNLLSVGKYHGNNDPIIIYPHNDHRVCMALVIMAISYGCEVVVNDYKVVNKSYSDFFNDLERIGVKLERYE